MWPKHGTGEERRDQRDGQGQSHLEPVKPLQRLQCQEHLMQEKGGIRCVAWTAWTAGLRQAHRGAESGCLRESGYRPQRLEASEEAEYCQHLLDRDDGKTLLNDSQIREAELPGHTAQDEKRLPERSHGRWRVGETGQR